WRFAARASPRWGAAPRECSRPRARKTGMSILPADGMNEPRIHQVFQLSILLKGLHAVIECAGGLALAVISNASITNLVGALTMHELLEDPNDRVAGLLLKGAQDL